MSESPQPSTSVLHKQWVKLENEHHQLAAEIDSARARGADLESMRKGQARLLLEINALVGPCCTDGAHRRGDAKPRLGYEIRT